MKLTTQTQVTVDGVIKGNGGAPDKDRRNGFERGGWALGRATPRPWRSSPRPTSAPTRSRSAGGPTTSSPPTGAPWIRAAIRFRRFEPTPKYLASTTITDPQWADTTVLSDDLAAAVGELKAKRGGELQVHGSGALIRSLLDHDLVDEIQPIVVPVVLGRGNR